MGEEYTGPERRKGDRRQVREPIHPWRWRFMAAWIVAFTIITFYGIRELRSQVHTIQEDKASIVSLRRTDCALRQFLLTARKARLKNAAEAKTEEERQANLAAAAGYARLAEIFSVRDCPGG